MKRSGIILAAAVCLFAFAGCGTQLKAQSYDPVPVTVSTEKVTLNGKVFLYHTVMERQTLYSIAKAYGVTVDEIYDANPTLHRTGLLKNTVILIPFKENADASAGTGNDQGTTPPPGTYKEHIVKWYETLDDISALYGIPAETIMAFNHMDSPKLSRRQVLYIPVQEEEPVVTDVPSEDNQEEAAVDLPVSQDTTIITVPDISDEELTLEEEEDDTIIGKSTVNIGLVLPFNADKRASTMTMDFYAGALLALRDLQAEGIFTHLSAYDMKAGVPSAAQLNKNDFVLGPISVEDLETILQTVNGGTTVVSPLEQKAVTLRDSFPNFVQAPSYIDNQYMELAQWLSEESRPGESIILLCEKGGSAICNAMKESLLAKGLSYEVLFYSVAEGARIPSRLGSMMQKGKNNHVIVASEDERFVSDAMRNLSIMDSRGYKVISYGTSKLRLMDSVDNNYYHQTSMHLTSAYYVDYDSPEVNRFILAFRALYSTEPSQFAFQGYDTAHYFISMCSHFGDKWMKYLDKSKVCMLHTDFMFSRNENGACSNAAIRRIVYNPDMSIVLVR